MNTERVETGDGKLLDHFPIHRGSNQSIEESVMIVAVGVPVKNELHLGTAPDYPQASAMQVRIGAKRQ